MLERNEMMRQRLAKIDAARTAGEIPYPNDFQPTHTGADLMRALFAHLESHNPDRTPGPAVRMAGRVMAVNIKGKVAFLRLRDRSGPEVLRLRKEENALRVAAGLEPREEGASTFQVFFQRNEDEVLWDQMFKGDRAIDLGDILGVVGRPFRTQTGEPSLRACLTDDAGALFSGEQAGAACVRVLTKGVRPLPEKYHGLQDKETRFRQRYVDLIMNDDTREIVRRRALVVRGLRAFFDSRDYLEVETPMMHTLLGGAAARPFTTHHNALDMPLYLRIAPELHLKRLVVGGLERVYELNRNFRNEGLSQRHNPEFTMLEFYRAYATYHDLMDEVETLFAKLAVDVTGSPDLVYGTNPDGTPRQISFRAPFARVTVHEGLQRWAGVAADDVNDVVALRKRADALDLYIDPKAGLGKVQMDLFEHAAEPHLIQPTFVMDFPAEVSPLSRRKDSDPTLVDRFELYVAGMEISNAFSELNDPVDQFERFEAQLAQKAQGAEETMDMDLDYVRALEYGLPPTAGCGIGVDRLVMLLTNTESIREVILFPHMRPENRVDAGQIADVVAPDSPEGA
jgi:lysyl-tRNA synthetase class 2